MKRSSIQHHRFLQHIQDKTLTSALRSFPRTGGRGREGSASVFDPQLAAGVAATGNDHTEPRVARVDVQPTPQSNVDLDAEEPERGNVSSHKLEERANRSLCAQVKRETSKVTPAPRTAPNVCETTSSSPATLGRSLGAMPMA